MILSDRFQLSPTIEFKSSGKIGTDIGIGLASRSYMHNYDQLAPYWGLRAGVIAFMGSNTGSKLQHFRLHLSLIEDSFK